MFKSVLLLGHFRGIRIEVHASWMIIFALLMITMTAGLQREYPDWTMMEALATSLFTALTFFASIVAHELGHSLVAIKRGVPVSAITLFIFGGIAQLNKDSENATDEFWIAIAGPIVSFVLALVFSVLSGLTGQWYEPVAVGFGWLAMINMIVALFNLIPGFPLDGGRVFRALVWKVTGDAGKGVRAAVAGGRLVAYGLFGVGLWNILVVGNFLGGIWIMLIAWFLLNMAEGHGQSFNLQNRLAGIRARDLADPHVPVVTPQTPVDEWIQNQVLSAGQRAFMVASGHNMLGLVSLSDAQHIHRDQWPATRVDEIMTPIDTVIHIEPDTGAAELLQLMTEHNLNQIPVMENGRVTGWIDRERVLRTISLHMELKA